MNNQTGSNDTTKKRRGPGDGPVLKSGGRDARKTAALVLEVLSGELNPAEAAEILQVGLPCYYQIEKRAFEGLIQACEKDGRKGRQKRAGAGTGDAAAGGQASPSIATSGAKGGWHCDSRCRGTQPQAGEWPQAPQAHGAGFKGSPVFAQRRRN